MIGSAVAESTRRITPLVALGLVALPLFLAEMVYLYGATFVPLFSGEVNHAGDFSFFVEGTLRFLADPATTYAGADFLYPPPSVVLFVPLVQLPVAWGYTALALLNMMAMTASVWLFIRLYERSNRVRTDPWPRFSLFAVAFASAPFFQTIKMGQVGGIVLLSCLAFLNFLPGRPLTAVGALLAGFWLKLYPMVLAVLAIKHVRRGRLAVGFAAGLVAVPIVLSPFIPLGLYAEYFTFATSSGNLSNVAAMNQGIPAVLSRLTLPPEAFTTYSGHVIPLLPKVLTFVIGLGFGLAFLWMYLREWLKMETVGVGLMALLPVVSVLGWEHTYILALPLVWWMLLRVSYAKASVQISIFLGALIFFVPKPPEPIVAALLEHAPRLFSEMLHARFLIVTLGFLVALLLSGLRKRPGLQSV